MLLPTVRLAALGAVCALLQGSSSPVLGTCLSGGSLVGPWCSLSALVSVL